MTISPYFRNEKHFTQSVRDAARKLGWLVYHPYNSERSTLGFPDLVMVRGETVIWAELKMPKGCITEYQKRWGDVLTEAGQIYYLWRPDDWDDILNLLISA